MNNDLATLLGRPRRLDAGGRTWKLYPQTLGTLARFQEWLDARLADPADLVYRNLDGLSPAAQGYLTGYGMVRLRQRRILIGHPEADDLTGSVGGITELLYLSVRRGDRRFTRRRAAELYWHLGDVGRRKVIMTIWGRLADGSPDGGGEDLIDPDSADWVDPQPIDWWGIFHRLTGEPWRYPPHWIARLTWPQVVCLTGDGKAPRYGVRIDSSEAHEAFLARCKADPWAP